jgi:hypothetical protein
MEIIIPIFLELIALPESEKPKRVGHAWQDQRIREPKIKKMRFKVEWGNSSQRDLAKKCALSAKRNADKLKAIPKWIDLDAVNRIYQLSKSMSQIEGIKYEVDHIVPLRNPLVCGLHWEGNLQVITKKANLLKRCSFSS